MISIDVYVFAPTRNKPDLFLLCPHNQAEEHEAGTRSANKHEFETSCCGLFTIIVCFNANWTKSEETKSVMDTSADFRIQAQLLAPALNQQPSHPLGHTNKVCISSSERPDSPYSPFATMGNLNSPWQFHRVSALDA